MTKRSGAARRKQAKQRAAAAPYPPWVLLERSCTEETHGSASSVADAKTRAASYTAAGNPISVALRAAAPPEPSRVCVQVKLPCAAFKVSHSTVLAAHGDSVLIDVAVEARWNRDRTYYFVYSAGDAAADPPRPPSLSPLPDLPPNHQRRFLSSEDTGLLRRGEDDELVVAALDMEPVPADEGAPLTSPTQMAPELLLFRSCKWSVRRPRVINNSDGTERDLAKLSWYTRTVVPVGDRMLCWSDQLHGVVFADVFDASPTLRYVPFPVKSPYGFRVCVTTAAGGRGDTVKLVAMFPRCCCGDEGSSQCKRSLHAYTVKTWMMRMDDMAWVLDGMIDSTEIWPLDAYKGLPRVELDDPVVSLDDPNTIIFALCEEHHVQHGADSTVRLLMVDTRRKTISPSIFRYPPERQYIRFHYLVPSRISSYLNSSYPSQGNGGTISSPSKIDVGTMAATNDASVNSSEQSFSSLSLGPMQKSEEVSLEKKVLIVLEEIPGLARDDMMKAFSVLIYDSGRRFRSLLELPKNLRKDWLLIEIKASEACSTCSACTKSVQHA